MQFQRRLPWLLLLVLALAGTYAYAQGAAPKRVRWEYLLIEWTRMGDQGLAKLGDEGWELVAVQTDIKSLESEMTLGGPREVRTQSWYYFKREK